jgi:hypothetical protein
MLGWFNNATLLKAATTMIDPMQALTVYSTRALSFEADVLNAIIGTLNSYAIYDVYHIWGVPLQPSWADYTSGPKDFLSPGRPLTRELDIAMLWFHEEPGTRRSGFPSWSPLGWKAPIKWSKMSKSKSQFYVSAEAATIRAKSDTGFHKLSDLANKEGFRSQEVSQYLEVEARTALCRLCIVGKEKVAISFPLGNGWDAFARVRWDLPPDKGTETVLKGVLLPGADFTETSVDCLYAHVLVLEQHQQHYERVGIARLPATFSHEEDFYRYWFFGLKDKFGNLYRDIQDPDFYTDPRYTIARENVPPPAVMVRYWWWKYFEPVTIILDSMYCFGYRRIIFRKRGSDAPNKWTGGYISQPLLQAVIPFPTTR